VSNELVKLKVFKEEPPLLNSFGLCKDAYNEYVTNISNDDHAMNLINI